MSFRGKKINKILKEKDKDREFVKKRKYFFSLYEFSVF